MKVNKLKGIMAERGYSGEKLAKAIGMNTETFRRKLRTGKFGVEEAEKISSALCISNPSDIFFGQEVT